MNTRTKVALALLLPVTLAADVPFCPFADAIEFFAPGPAAAGDPDFAVGEPSGQGSFSGSSDVATLGLAGALTLHLSSTTFNGPGTDLIVCENPFYLLSQQNVFIEAMFVDVSSDGITFARFPTAYSGETGPFAPFTGVPVTWHRGFAGVLPVSANPALGVPVLDVVAAGGDAFDLADLANEPQVLSGDVDIDDIRFVRLTDAVSGTALDSAGNIVWDSGIDSSASADVDAVIAVNSTCTAIGGRPAVELSLVSGFLTIAVYDTNGFSDIKQKLSASVNGVALPFTSLLPFFVITALGPTGVTLVTGPVPPGVYPITLKVAAEDASGLFGGDSLTLP